MKTVIFLIYNILVAPLIYIGFKIGALFNDKIKAGNKGRKGQKKIIRESLSEIKHDVKKVLFHCTSVGEWEQAAPIIEGIKKNNPELFIVVSFFSPSGYRFVKNHPDVNLKVYMPLDVYWKAKWFLKTISFTSVINDW